MQHPALRYFAAVAQSGSFREAAETLHVAQSALSRQVLRLEEELGVMLLERHARGVSLTQAGEIFLRHARASAAQTEQLRAEIDALRGLRRGSLRIAAVETVVQDFFPEVISQFSERYPGVRLDIGIDTSDRVVEQVRELRVDLGFAFHPPAGGDITVLHRSRAPLIALMAPSHPLAGQAKIALAEAFAYPLALPAPHTGSRVLIDQACRVAGLYAAPALESNSTQLLTQFVRQGQAITFLTYGSGGSMLRDGTLAAVRIRERLMNSSTLDVIAPAARKLSVAAEEFLKVVRNRPGETMSSGPAHDNATAAVRRRTPRNRLLSPKVNDATGRHG